METHDQYFKQKRNVAGTLGHNPYQNITAALRMLAYGTAADFFDDCLAIGESITIQSLRYFVKAVIDIFDPDYL